MNKYFRAIGFSDPITAAGLQSLINEVLASPEYRAYTTNGEETLLAEFRMSFSKNCGVSVVGEFDANDQFRYEYSYPYYISETVSTMQNVTIEPRIREEAYAGVVDDLKLGVTLIFHVQNLIDFVRMRNANTIRENGMDCMLAALSVEGTVVLPIRKTERDIQLNQRKTVKRTKLIKASMDGDEEAMEKLTMEDMDTYAAISRQIQTQDVYSIVDSYFMPFGVECDMYSVMGEILACEFTENKVTGEELCQMEIECNGLRFALCINRSDLYGEPAPGRRFKGVVWMQGTVELDQN